MDTLCAKRCKTKNKISPCVGRREMHNNIRMFPDHQERIMQYDLQRTSREDPPACVSASSADRLTFVPDLYSRCKDLDLFLPSVDPETAAACSAELNMVLFRLTGNHESF